MNEARFILANTRLLAVPLAPEIRLHLAEESLPIWQKTEEELGRLNVPPPWWAFAWAGGQALARHLLDHPVLVAGHSVLDLGAGSGLAGIAAMKAGAARVLAADTDPFAVAAIALNARVNAVALEATDRDLLAARPAPFDAILVGDLFYERPLAERVLAFLEAAREAGAAVLVGDPHRSYFPTEHFVELAHYSVPVTRDLEDAEIKRASVWNLARRPRRPERHRIA
jgi:predicted nicotinamide N-methyase